MTGLNRRRFLTIAAGAAATLTVGGRATPAPAHFWRGTALGAEAAIHLDGMEAREAGPLIDACLSALSRLEDQFSLYRANSALSRLNRDGFLEAPDPVFLELLSRVRAVHRATGEAFDPTVQPVWEALASHHAGDPSGADPSLEDRPIGFDQVSFSASRIAYAKAGMAMTLNGIAQGFITDRIADLLRARGLSHVLVNMGEIRALDGRRDGTAWPVTIRPRPDSSGPAVLHLENRSVATSATLGTVLDAAGRVGHIVDPINRRPVGIERQITVTAPTATIADALSTAFCVLDQGEIASALQAFEGAEMLATEG